jgi:hypothetical protein
MHEVRTSIHPNRSRYTAYLFLVCGFLLWALTLSGQVPTPGPKPGVVRQAF